MNLKKIHLILFLKPYYKWTAFNTEEVEDIYSTYRIFSFKPYYKRTAFNTNAKSSQLDIGLTPF